MSSVVAIVQARVGSTRLPGKVLRELGGKTVLEQVVARARAIPRVDQVVVATSTTSADGAIEELAARRGWAVFRGSEEDVLDRYHAAALHFGAEHVLRVTADNPLLGIEEADQVIAAHLQGGTAYTHGLQVWGSGMPIGTGAEIMTFAALARSWREGHAAHHREHVNEYIGEHPELFSTARVDAPPELQRPTLRLTLDTPEDLQLQRVLYERLQQGEEPVALRRVVQLLDAEPDLAAGTLMSGSVDLLFRADASAAIGGGHLMRCLALAQAAVRRGGEVSLLTRPESHKHWASWRALGAEVFPLHEIAGSQEDARATVDEALRRQVGAVVVDGYLFDAPYRAVLTGPSGRTDLCFLFIDDLGGVSLPPGNVVVNTALDVPRDAYGPGGRVLLGADYVLLRDEFLAMSPRDRGELRTLLVTAGASDPDRSTFRMLTAVALATPSPSLTVRVVVGPDNEHQDELRAHVDRLGLRAELVISPSNMAQEIAGADAAISAAGSTVWELAQAGCPAVVVVAAENQRANGESLSRRGAFLVVEPGDDGDQRLRHQVAILLADATRRAELSARSRRLVDGRGRERILDTLAEARSDA